jgi:hypothetical protein
MIRPTGSLGIRCTDGTLLHFKFVSSQIQIKPKYLEARCGDLELIRNYGTIPTDNETEDD